MSDSNWQPQPEAWRRAYHETGYLVVPNAVDAQTLEELKSVLERIERDFNADTLPRYLKGHISTDRDRSRMLGKTEEGGKAISNIMELPLFDPLLRDFITYPRVLDILEALFESSEFAFHNYKCIAKMPHNQTPFQWHRDLPYLQHTTSNLLTCMLCLDAMTPENGATVVCPGSHQIAHEDVKPGDINIAESEVPQPRVTVECPAGSAVVFHVSLVHGGGPNFSEAKRRNVIGIWAGPDSFPTASERFAYEFVMPRSQNPMRQKQIQMTFGNI